MTKIILNVMSLIKGRRIQLDDKVPIGYLLRLIFDKGISLLRGIIKTRRLIFLGRGVEVQASNFLISQKGVEIGAYSFIDCLSKGGLRIGKGSKIGRFSIVRVSGTLTDLGGEILIGSNVGIGDYAHIGGAGAVVIGDDTITGAYLSIHPENHVYDSFDIPIREQGVSRKGISIGENCWLGAKVTLLDGSSIGNGCIVAAGSVVTKKFGDNLIVGGVPAKVLKERS